MLRRALSGKSQGLILVPPPQLQFIDASTGASIIHRKQLAAITSNGFRSTTVAREREPTAASSDTSGALDENS